MPALEAFLERRALRLSIAEGCAWALMVGLAESYFIAIAVHLGATPLQLGLVVALPLALGGLGPLTTIALLRWRPRRRPLAGAGGRPAGRRPDEPDGPAAARPAPGSRTHRRHLPLPDGGPGRGHGLGFVVR